MFKCAEVSSSSFPVGSGGRILELVAKRLPLDCGLNDSARQLGGENDNPRSPIIRGGPDTIPERQAKAGDPISVRFSPGLWWCLGLANTLRLYTQAESSVVSLGHDHYWVGEV